MGLDEVRVRVAMLLTVAIVGFAAVIASQPAQHARAVSQASHAPRSPWLGTNQWIADFARLPWNVPGSAMQAARIASQSARHRTGFRRGVGTLGEVGKDPTAPSSVWTTFMHACPG